MCVCERDRKRGRQRERERKGLLNVELRARQTIKDLKKGGESEEGCCVSSCGRGGVRDPGGVLVEPLGLGG